MRRIARQILTLGFTLLILGASAVGQPETATRVQAAAGSRVYSLEVPVGWQQMELREEKEFGPVLLRVGAPGGVSEGAVYLQRFPKQQMTFESYKTAAKNYIQNKMQGQVISEQDVTVDQQRSWEIQYEGNGPGYVDEPRRFLNTVMFDGDSIVVVHCAAKPEVWKELADAFTTISRSLTALDREN